MWITVGIVANRSLFYLGAVMRIRYRGLCVGDGFSHKQAKLVVANQRAGSQSKTRILLCI